MPLIPQQDIVSATGPNAGSATAALHQLLESYPPCRIVSISIGVTPIGAATVVAVIETI